MAHLRIDLLGGFAVYREGKPVSLPASKKTRALLAYLVATDRPHRRDRLCEMFWDIPDDPRGALRWSLSKLRRVVNEPGLERLFADRERVRFVADDVELDFARLTAAVASPQASLDALLELQRALAEPLLDGVDLPNQAAFQAWLTAERQEHTRLRARCAEQLAKSPEAGVERALEFSRSWLELDPYNNAAGADLLARLKQLGLAQEAYRLNAELTTRFSNAGVPWPVGGSAEAGRSSADNGTVHDRRASRRELLSRQRIQFCTAADGAKIAYASVGQGPPLVKAANWLNHLELDWDAPIWSPLFRELARDHLFVRYDERGNGLSDWDVTELSFDAFVADLESVVAALGLARFPLLGISQGASVSIEYAVRHPERVSHLILFGAYAAGWRIDATEQEVMEREAVMTLTATGWGRDNPVYRQIFSSTFMPSATPEELAWFNEFQRNTTSPENAVRFLSAFGDIDVRNRLTQVRVPTLVIHSRGDKRIPFESGREIAASIPNAEFVGLDSDDHLLLGREPASRAFVDAVRRFIAN